MSDTPDMVTIAVAVSADVAKSFAVIHTQQPCSVLEPCSLCAAVRDELVVRIDAWADSEARRLSDGSRRHGDTAPRGMLFGYPIVETDEPPTDLSDVKLGTVRL